VLIKLFFQPRVESFSHKISRLKPSKKVCLEIKKKEEKAIKMSKEEKSSLWLEKMRL